MGQVRLNESRDETTREASAHATAEWKPPSTLEAPPPRDGMRQRWIRTSILGDDESHHVMKRKREGWNPRPADTIPDSFPIPTMDHGQWKGSIGVEGMILCEMPEVTALQRDSYYSGKAQEQESATANDLNSAESRGGMALGADINRTSTKGPGRQPQED